MSSLASQSPVLMQVELAAALGLPMFAGPPPVHSALSNRWTASNIFATAGIASPPGVPIAAKPKDFELNFDGQLPSQSRASGSPGNDNLSDVNNTIGHAHCAACHPVKPVPFLAEYEPSEKTRLPREDEHGAVNSAASAGLHSADSSSDQYVASRPQHDLDSASCNVSTAETDHHAVVSAASSLGPSDRRATADTCEAVIAEVCACYAGCLVYVDASCCGLMITMRHRLLLPRC